jgi:hypothetical protein
MTARTDLLYALGPMRPMLSALCSLLFHAFPVHRFSQHWQTYIASDFEFVL